MNFKRFILLAALFSATVTAAQEAVPANESFALLTFPRDAALSGMAGAGDASVSGSQAFAAFANPATLPLAASRLSAGLSYAYWAPARPVSLSNNVGGAVAARLGRVGISVGGVLQAHPEQDFGSDGSYAPKDLALAAGAGLLITSKLSLGVAVRYARERFLADYSQSTVTFTAMAQYQLGGLNLAAGVSNLGSGAKSQSGNVSPLPASARLAADYSIPLGSSSLEAALDADYYFIGKMSVAGGLCYSFRQLLFARAGYRYASAGAALPSHLALGAGVRFHGVHADISYLTASQALGNTIMAGIGIDFFI